MKGKTIYRIYAAMAVVIASSTITFITFAILRVCDVIGWSWWVVSIPIWITAIAVIAAISATALMVVAARKLSEFYKENNIHKH